MTAQVGTTADPARQSAEDYLGRPMSDAEYDQLIRATYAEADPGNATEAAMVAASILNRAQQQGTTVTNVLMQKNQFESVTGSAANGYAPSTNFVNGPSPDTRNFITGSMTSTMPRVSHQQTNFTASQPAAYAGPGHDLGYLSYAQNNYSRVGGSLFNTAPPDGSQVASVPTGYNPSMPNIRDPSSVPQPDAMGSGTGLWQPGTASPMVSPHLSPYDTPPSPYTPPHFSDQDNSSINSTIAGLSPRDQVGLWLPNGIRAGAEANYDHPSSPSAQAPVQVAGFGTAPSPDVPTAQNSEPPQVQRDPVPASMWDDHSPQPGNIAFSNYGADDPSGPNFGGSIAFSNYGANDPSGPNFGPSMATPYGAPPGWTPGQPLPLDAGDAGSWGIPNQGPPAAPARQPTGSYDYDPLADASLYHTMLPRTPAIDPNAYDPLADGSIYSQMLPRAKPVAAAAAPVPKPTTAPTSVVAAPPMAPPMPRPAPAYVPSALDQNVAAAQSRGAPVDLAATYRDDPYAQPGTDDTPVLYDTGYGGGANDNPGFNAFVYGRRGGRIVKRRRA